MAYSTDSSSFSAIKRHDDYYINGGDLYFLVEKVAFRVHRFFFERESPRFKGQLSIPASPGVARQGTSDSNAIVLEGVKAADFAKFLWVFYNPKYSLYNACVEDWVGILELSHKWQFSEVKDLCVRELQKLQMNDVDRVAAYNTYEVDHNLLVPVYARLCEREYPLSLQEGLKLGMEVAIKIATARETARGSSVPRTPTAVRLEENEMSKIVRDLFEIPLPLPDDLAPPMTPIKAAFGSSSASSSTVPPGTKPTGPSHGRQGSSTAPPTNITIPPSNGTTAPTTNGTATTSGTTPPPPPANGAAKGATLTDKKDEEKEKEDKKAKDDKKSGAASSAAKPDEKADAESVKAPLVGLASGNTENSRPNTPTGKAGRTPWNRKKQ